MRVCSDLSCGCATPDCYTVSDHGNILIFVDEESNKQYSISKDMVVLGLKTKSLAVNKKKLSKAAYEKLKDFLGV